MSFLEPVTVKIRDENLDIVGVLDDYTSLQMIPRFNAVGAFVVEMNAASSQAHFMVPGNGLIISRGGAVIMSGTIREPNWTKSSSDGGDGKLTVNGVDDMALLAGATCWPNPTAAAGSQTDDTYTISGVVAGNALRTLVDLNIGPGAHADRKIANLTLAAATGLGSSVTKQLNQFDNLLTVLQEIAKIDTLGFRVVQVGANLEFQVYEPSDLSQTAKFTFGLGNLTDASYSVTYPTCTKAVVVAGGNTSPRVVQIYTRADAAFPGPWVEQFVDKTGVDSASVDLAAQMDQAADEALTSGAAQTNLTMNPIDTPGLQFGVDYTVGDTITCQVRDDYVSDVVREVQITYEPSGGYTAKAVIGSSDGTNNEDAMAKSMDYIRRIFERLRRVETRKQA